MSPWGSWVYTYGITTNQLTQTGLTPGTWYHWQVRAVCGSSSNMSGFTSYNTFSTLSSSRVFAGDISVVSDLNIYPNPTRGIFNIEFVSEEIDNFEITIIDSYGKLIFEEIKIDFAGEYNNQLDLSSYPAGVYILKIKTKESFVNKRIILQ